MPSNKKKDEEKVTETVEVLVINDSNHHRLDEFHSLKKNCMIMFNHDEFLNGTTRPWSEGDKKILKNTLEKLGFRGVVHDNFKKRNLIEAVKTFSQRDFTEYGCVCVSILTNGHDPGFLQSYNRWYNECEVFQHFDVAKNPSLAKKPIIFVIQATRGADVTLTGSRRGSKPDKDLEKKHDLHLPVDATRIVFHNAYTEGACSDSWLTQTLCQKINGCSFEYDLIQFFRKAINSAEFIEDAMGWQQTLSCSSNLTRHVYLKNKKPAEPPSSPDDDEDVEMTSISYTQGPSSQDSKDNFITEMAQFNATNGTLENMPDLYPLSYELEKFSENAMIIFNHEHFTNSRNARTGTAHDVCALENTFKRFRFRVEKRIDLNKRKLLGELQKFGDQDFTNYGCICVAILTHGDDNGILEAADTSYKEREVFACFNTHTNRTLVGKPIIFLIQACRGKSLARTVLMNHFQRSSSVELDVEKNKLSGYCLPTEADMIIFHSCFFGRASVRLIDEGTWFIQTICEKLNRHASTEHLENIFRRVRIDIAMKTAFEDGKQMPVMTSTLLKELYLVERNVMEE